MTAFACSEGGLAVEDAGDDEPEFVEPPIRASIGSGLDCAFGSDDSAGGVERSKVPLPLVASLFSGGGVNTGGSGLVAVFGSSGGELGPT
jgi:hypothetical protein